MPATLPGPFPVSLETLALLVDSVGLMGADETPFARNNSNHMFQMQTSWTLGLFPKGLTWASSPLSEEQRPPLRINNPPKTIGSILLVSKPDLGPLKWIGSNSVSWTKRNQQPKKKNPPTPKEVPGMPFGSPSVCLTPVLHASLSVISSPCVLEDRNNVSYHCNLSQLLFSQLQNSPVLLSAMFLSTFLTLKQTLSKCR